MQDQFVTGYSLNLSTTQTIIVAKGAEFLSANATDGPLPYIRLLALVVSGDKIEKRTLEVQPLDQFFRTPAGFQRKFITTVYIYGMTFSIFEITANP